MKVLLWISARIICKQTMNKLYECGEFKEEVDNDEDVKWRWETYHNTLVLWSIKRGMISIIIIFKFDGSIEIQSMIEILVWSIDLNHLIQLFNVSFLDEIQWIILRLKREKLCKFQSKFCLLRYFSLGMIWEKIWIPISLSFYVITLAMWLTF